MMKRYFSAFASCVIVALAVSGCSGGSNGGSSSPSVSDSSPSSGLTSVSPSLPYAGAPKVAIPLPASAIAGDPCVNMLTPERVPEIVGTPAETKRADEASIGPGCDWLNTKTGGHVIAAYATALHGGLSATYENVKPRAEVWREIASVQGFPAVAYVSPSGGSPDRFCQVSTGLTDDLTLEVSVFISSGKIGNTDPCEAASFVNDLIMTTIKEKAGL